MEKRKGRGLLWLLPCLLLLVLLSAALVGSLLGRVTAPSQDCVIPLAPQGEGGVARQALVAVQRPVFRTVSSRSVIRHREGDLRVRDQDGVLWRSETQVDLFRAAYGENGDSVRSDNSDKLLAPGTGFDYEFSLYNNGEMYLDYGITLEVEPFWAVEPEEELPLRWRLCAEDGTELTPWRSYGSPEELLEQGGLPVGARRSYHLQWAWDFERENAEGKLLDEKDTELGTSAVEHGPLGLKATIRVTAEGDDTYVVELDDWDNKKPSKKPGSILEILPDTGDGNHPLLYLLMLLFSLGALLLLFLLPAHKKDEDEEAQEDDGHGR